METPVQNPLRLVFWESTSRCNLACIHCRRQDVAEAAAADDLATDEVRAVIRSAATLGRPIFVFSGGEPLMRPDWADLAACARELGLPTALATNGTLIDSGMAARIAQAGFHRVSISFDGADAATHDAFRGVSGAFDRARAGAAHLHAAGVPIQVNATIAAHNAHQLDALMELAASMHAVAMHLFLLVPVGCGVEIDATHQLSPQRYEEVLQWICDRQAGSPLEIKATCAPHYHRVAAMRCDADVPSARVAGILPASERGMGVSPVSSPFPAVYSLSQQQRNDIDAGGTRTGRLPATHADKMSASPSDTGKMPVEHMGETPMPRVGHGHRASRGCLCGLSIVFVSHKGEVFPCGYLPVDCGTVRTRELADIWRTSPVFAKLRDFDALRGKCGRCEYRRICGGCRARAFAATGDYLAEEPSCTYQPRRP